MPILRALIEMVADPLGAEVAPPPAAALKQEAERLSALYHTALQAMASIEQLRISIEPPCNFKGYERIKNEKGFDPVRQLAQKIQGECYAHTN